MHRVTHEAHNAAPTTTAKTSFTELLIAYEAPIGRYLARLVGDPELASDLTQDTFLAAYRALPHTIVADPHAWLFRIATNHALACFRRRKVIRWLSLGQVREGDRALTVPDHAGRITDETTVALALACLAPKDRACLLLQIVGFSAADIAAQLGCSIGAARTRLCRAREAFRHAYQHGLEEPQDA